MNAKTDGAPDSIDPDSITTENVDLEKMAKVTGISLAEIKAMFGVPLPQGYVSRFEEARNTYNANPYESLERTLASISMVGLASTFAEIEVAHSLAPLGSEVERTALIRMVELASTFAEITKAHGLAQFGGEVGMRAFRKLASFFPKP